MHLHTALVNDQYNDIPGVLVNGWSGSWKKYLFSLMTHNDWYLLYPGYKQVRLVYRILLDSNWSCTARVLFFVRACVRATLSLISGSVACVDVICLRKCIAFGKRKSRCRHQILLLRFF